MTVIVRAIRRRPWWSAAGVLLLVVVVLTVWLAGRAATGPPPELATAGTGTVDRTVVVAGTVEPSQRADLDFPAGGQVVSVSAVVGQQVTAGQSLAAVDAATLAGQVAQARSGLAAAEARLDADQEADASDAQLDADRAAIDSAGAQLDVAEQNEDGATLTAPFAGTVAAVNVTVGEQVAGGRSTGSLGGSAAAAGAGQGAGAGAGGSGGAGGGSGGSGAGGSGAAAAAAAAGGAGGSGTAAVVVVSTGSYLVDATVDDTQVGQVQVGQTARITPSGAAGTIPGTVSSVALVATTTSGIAGYPVTIAVSGSPTGLFIGSGAQVEIVTEEIPDAVLVPSAAVRGAGEDTVVTVSVAGVESERPVVVGVTSAGNTQIVQGLTAGETVVLPPAGTVPEDGGFGGGFGGGQGGNQGGSGGQGGNGNQGGSQGTGGQGTGGQDTGGEGSGGQGTGDPGPDGSGDEPGGGGS